MTPRVYYNDTDEYACNWLANLMLAGLIPEGDIDQRSIRDVTPGDLRGYTQCHFFAGLGGWPRALYLAGWPEDREVWTGSCPCQPFSAAGKQRGAADDRHLFPVWRELIAKRNPATVFGEQVASKLGRQWLARVRLEMEGLGYGVGAADLCAASVGAPHIRQRLWFVADAYGGVASDGELQRSGQHRQFAQDRSAMFVADAMQSGWTERRPFSGQRQITGGGVSELGDAAYQQQQHRRRNAGSGRRHEFTNASVFSELGDAESVGLLGGQNNIDQRRGQRTFGQAGAGDFWSDYDLIPCRDGKARRVEPGTFPLAHGIPARVAKLRAFGNAIVPQVAAEFIKAYLEC